MKKLYYFLFAFAITASVFYSCKCDCGCHKITGCRIVLAKLVSNDSIIASDTFCSEKDMYDNQAIYDSISTFRRKYYSSTVTVEDHDSLTTNSYIGGLGCHDQDAYRAQGYGCECNK